VKRAAMKGAGQKRQIDGHVDRPAQRDPRKDLVRMYSAVFFPGRIPRHEAPVLFMLSRDVDRIWKVNRRV